MTTNRAYIKLHTFSRPSAKKSNFCTLIIAVQFINTETIQRKKKHTEQLAIYLQGNNKTKSNKSNIELIADPKLLPLSPSHARGQ